jgi:hypothetical protein
MMQRDEWLARFWPFAKVTRSLANVWLRGWSSLLSRLRM